MAYIASYVGRKVSPTKTVNAQMDLCEEFAVETAINYRPEPKKRYGQWISTQNSSKKIVIVN